MVPTPPGEFIMGGELSPSQVVSRFGGHEDSCRDEQPRHLVRITRPFRLAACEVTVAEFRRFVEATGYITDAEREGWAYGYRDAQAQAVPGMNWRNPGFPQADDHPVVCVSWNDATAYCAWRSRAEGRRFRLPTEAEWEYACRAGTTTIWWWGDEPDAGGRVANVADAAHWSSGTGYRNMPMDDGFEFTAPVGRYRPNGLGLYDMIGNVVEWCADRYGPYTAEPARDPAGPSTGAHRVLRGGSWYNVTFYCRSAYRFRLSPGDRYHNVGFRIASDE